MKKIFYTLCSLKLAVLIILSLALALVLGTLIESQYDTPTAQYWVYQSKVFYFLLVILGLNIFCVALSRFPWKKQHFPFLMAHFGILTLLLGSWITDRAGVDGIMRLSEGESTSVVELGSAVLITSDEDRVQAFSVPWIPPYFRFKPVSVQLQGISHALMIDQYLTHADGITSFVPRSHESKKKQTQKQAAVHFKLVGGVMGISQDIWLWEGSPSWKSIQLGPARFVIGKNFDSTVSEGIPQFRIGSEQDGGLSYSAKASNGSIQYGKIREKSIQGQTIQTGWKGNPQIVLEEWIADATPLTVYHEARVQYGNQAPGSAIHIRVSSEEGVWIGLGDRAVLRLENRDVELGYFPKRIILPFSIRLERFQIDYDPGTQTPAAYSSQVSINSESGEKKNILIRMNEPLQVQGFTFYQASYEASDELENSRPMTSILSVNQDPGRICKYTGSAWIVLGSLFLFAAKYRKFSRSSRLIREDV